MHANISRSTFSARKHYSAVLTQQGRVQLDADVNENTAIQQHHLRTLARDLIGPFGGPRDDAGFEITATRAAGGAIADVRIGWGRYYVDGLLVEHDPPARSEATTPVGTAFADQPHGSGGDDPGALDPSHLVYLSVWEREITSIQDPEIHEVALGSEGPDTSARVQIAWRVRVIDAVPGSGDPLPEPGDDDADVRGHVLNNWHGGGRWEAGLQGARGGLMAARVRGEGLPGAGFRGLENQLYRVEVHAGGDAAPATFKWARDNGSTVFAIDASEGARLTLALHGHERKLEIGQPVEYIDEDSIGLDPRPLLRVRDFDGAGLVTLDDDPAVRPGRRPFLRAWDGVAEIEPGAWVGLENGVEVRFEPGGYRAGDHWLIPARTETRDVEWPRDAEHPEALPPSGPVHHFAPLALLTRSRDVDLRCVFEPAAMGRCRRD